jgi:hypothetical protein
MMRNTDLLLFHQLIMKEMRKKMHDFIIAHVIFDNGCVVTHLGKTGNLLLRSTPLFDEMGGHSQHFFMAERCRGAFARAQLKRVLLPITVKLIINQRCKMPTCIAMSTSLKRIPTSNVKESVKLARNMA